MNAAQIIQAYDSLSTLLREYEASKLKEDMTQLADKLIADAKWEKMA